MPLVAQSCTSAHVGGTSLAYHMKSISEVQKSIYSLEAHGLVAYATSVAIEIAIHNFWVIWSWLLNCISWMAFMWIIFFCGFVLVRPITKSSRPHVMFIALGGVWDMPRGTLVHVEWNSSIVASPSDRWSGCNREVNYTWHPFQQVWQMTGHWVIW